MKGHCGCLFPSVSVLVRCRSGFDFFICPCVSFSHSIFIHHFRVMHINIIRFQQNAKSESFNSSDQLDDLTYLQKSNKNSFFNRIRLKFQLHLFQICNIFLANSVMIKVNTGSCHGTNVKLSEGKNKPQC